MEYTIKDQMKDMESRKERPEIEITLTDEQYRTLLLAAYKAGFEEPGAFITEIIADLTGWHGHSLKERMLINSWYDRMSWEKCNHAFFRYHLIYCFYEKDIEELLENSDYFEEVYNEYCELNCGMELESKEHCFDILKSMSKSKDKNGAENEETIAETIKQVMRLSEAGKAKLYQDMQNGMKGEKNCVEKHVFNSCNIRKR